MDRYLEAKQISRILTEAGFPTMLAGGCVRDRLLGREPKDYDLATVARPNESSAFFSGLGYKTVPLGLDHGTISLVTRLQTIEITTLRKDVRCFGRKAEVVFSQSFEEDAKRRDFTINALFEDMDGHVHDHTGGLHDLAAKKLCFVGDAGERIREDFLRILRYFRFLARLGWRPVHRELNAIHGNVGGLKHLSAERIHAEMKRLLVAPHAAESLQLMEDTGTLETLFPWRHAPNLEDVRHLLEDGPFSDATLAWFVFLFRAREQPWTRSELASELVRLRFSRKQRNAIISLNRLFNSSKKPIASSGRCLLKIVEDSLVNKEDLLDFCQIVSNRGSDWVDPTWITLLRGMIKRPRPEIPEDPLLRIIPEERGKASDIAKLYWFLELCQGAAAMAKLLENWKYYEHKLCNKDLAPVC